MHKLYKVVDFKFIQEYVIWVQFDDDAEQIIDLEPVLYGEIWGPLRDHTFFLQAKLDPIAHTLAWPNEADFDPETLRNWPEYVDELTERARQWKEPLLLAA
ncbi:MAG: DUF2442 domain-containing protein [Chloroflexota bacterium]